MRFLLALMVCVCLFAVGCEEASTEPKIQEGIDPEAAKKQMENMGKAGEAATKKEEKAEGKKEEKAEEKPEAKAEEKKEEGEKK